MMVAPNSPRARANASSVPASTPRLASGSVMVKKTRHSPRAQRAGKLLEFHIHLLKRRPRRAHKQRQRHGRQRQHHRAPGENHVHAKSLVQPAGQPDRAGQKAEAAPARSRRAAAPAAARRAFPPRLAAPVFARQPPRQREPNRQNQQQTGQRHPQRKTDELPFRAAHLDRGDDSTRKPNCLNTAAAASRLKIGDEFLRRFRLRRLLQQRQRVGNLRRIHRPAPQMPP